VRNGATWFVVTRLRHSSRRSFPDEQGIMSTGHHRFQDGDGVRLMVPPAIVTVRSAMVGPVELVAGDEDGRLGGGSGAQQAVDDVAAGLIEAGVGLVEQPEARRRATIAAIDAPALTAERRDDDDERRPSTPSAAIAASRPRPMRRWPSPRTARCRRP
jgi:hypothetical protein